VNILESLKALLSNFFSGSRASEDLEEELRSHIQHRADDLGRSGLSLADAERRARVEFGGYQHFKEESHEAMGGQFMERLLQDVRFGLRMLYRAPTFTAVVIVTVALGIGINAVVFSVLNGLILRPLNVPQAENLYTVEQGKDKSPMQSYPDYLDLRDRNHSLSGIAAYSITRAGLNVRDGHASAAWLYEASGNYFDVLGIQPQIGRLFHGSDEHGLDSAPYIVLSYRYWRSRFQSDSSVIGRTVQVNKHPFTIIGVTPRDFGGTELYFSPDFWVPMVEDAQLGGGNDLTARAARGIQLIARVRSGTTPAQSQADLNSVASYLAKAYPKDDEQMSFSPARPGLMGDMIGRPAQAFLTMLMLLAGLILLAACANLGSLYAARAADRAKEVAMRLSLGSNRARILRQFMTEALIISLVGGSVGLGAGILLLRWLSVWQPVSNFPIRLPVNPDIRVYALALILSLASGALFGLIPIRQVLRANPYQVLKAGSGGVAGRRVTPRDIALVVQIAVCAVLVTASLVAVKGLQRSLQSSFGFVPQSAIVVDTDLDMAGYQGDAAPVMQRRMLNALQDVPGVTSAGISDMLPLSRELPDNVAVYRDNATELRVANTAAEAVVQSVSPGYFEAAGTTLLTGRDFTWHDDKEAPRVAVVNEEFAHKVFGSKANPVGLRYKLGDGTHVQVIGVVEDGRYRTLTEEIHPAMFLSILQSPSSSTWLVARFSHDSQFATRQIDSKLRGLDGGLPFTVKTWDSELNGALFASRVATVTLGALGGLGVMLAITGIFGMASYSVGRRLREFGIRIALGASSSAVLIAAVGKAFRLLAIGSVLGLVLGIAAPRVLSSIVFEANARDPLVLGGVVLAMFLVGLLATWIPALRALKANPSLLLRDQ